MYIFSASLIWLVSTMWVMVSYAFISPVKKCWQRSGSEKEDTPMYSVTSMPSWSEAWEKRRRERTIWRMRPS